jgi:hypothetical protein
MKSRPELGGMLSHDLLGHERIVHNGKFVAFLSIGIEIKASFLQNFITTSLPFTTE